MSILRIIAAIVCVGSLVSNSLYASDPSDWEEIGNDDGIEVFKKEIPGSPVVAFKGKGLIQAPISKVASILMDTSRAVEWVDRLEEAKLVRKISDVEYVEYDHIGTPPIIMKDRDFVILFKAEVDLDQRKFTLKLSSIEDATTPETNYVRGQIIGTSYILKAISSNQTHVTVEVHADPKGGVPKWVVNLFQKEWPKNTLESLRKQAEKTDIKENVYFSRIFQKMFKLEAD